MSLRVVKNGRVGFAATSRTNDAKALVAAAIETAQFGAVSRLEFPGASSYPQVETFDPEVERVTLDEMAQLGQAMIDKVRGRSDELLCDASVTKATVSVQIVNSRGGRAGYKKSIFAISVDGNLIRGTDMLFVGESESSCHPLRDYAEVAESTITQLELARNTATVKSGNLPVVFTPRGVASALMAPLAGPFNGKLVLQGASPLGHRVGEHAFDPRFSVWDDPTQPFRPQSSPCDDEGVAHKPLALIRDGIISNFYYDLQTAGLAKARSTGHGARSGGLPAPSVSALIISEGDATFEDMVNDMKEGLVVETLMGAEQGNVLAGDFSGNVLLGYKVEGGKIVGRVKDTMVSGNIYTAMRTLAGLGSKSRWVGSNLKTPAVYFSSLPVASKS